MQMRSYLCLVHLFPLDLQLALLCLPLLFFLTSPGRLLHFRQFAGDAGALPSTNQGHIEAAAGVAVHNRVLLQLRKSVTA